MSKKFVNKLAIHFEIPVENIADKVQVREAKNKLVESINTYSDSLKLDPNILVVDMVIIAKPEDYLTRADTPVNAHIAELMASKTDAINKNAKKKSDLPVPSTSKPKAKDDDEPPRVKAMTMEEIKAAQEEESIPAPKVKPVVKQTADDDVKVITDKVFEKLKRTEKSVAIISAFAKAGKEVTIDELAKLANIPNRKDVSSWLAQTSKKIKAIEMLGGGVYKLNPDKV
ncbi:hypothetical protein CCP3SC5AM1_1520007 [Gammaproteobacteria bacterium]